MSSTAKLVSHITVTATWRTKHASAETAPRRGHGAGAHAHASRPAYAAQRTQRKPRRQSDESEKALIACSKRTRLWRCHPRMQKWRTVMPRKGSTGDQYSRRHERLNCVAVTKSKMPSSALHTYDAVPFSYFATTSIATAQPATSQTTAALSTRQPEAMTLGLIQYRLNLRRSSIAPAPRPRHRNFSSRPSACRDAPPARCVLSLRMRHLAAKSSEQSLIDALPPELIEHIFKIENSR